MKVIEGSPQEINEYLERQKEPDIMPFDIRNKRAFNRFVWRDQTKIHGRHWSQNKMQWVQISEMDSSYILNVMRKMLRENKNEELLKNDEFQSLSINLADRLVEGE
jgi:hypothetical protein